MIDKQKYIDMVSHPGKFEGEPPETAYYYECMMDGDGQQVEEDLTVFSVTTEEAEVFGIRSPFYTIYEDSQGFVYGESWTLKRYSEIAE